MAKDYDSSQMPEFLPADGQTFEWKRETIYGKPDPTYVEYMHVQGWLPALIDGEEVRWHGLLLMERPSELTEAARAEEAQAAASLAGLPISRYESFDFAELTHKDGNPSGTISRKWIPAEAIDDRDEAMFWSGEDRRHYSAGVKMTDDEITKAFNDAFDAIDKLKGS